MNDIERQIYDECVIAASYSDCTKRRFGAVAYYNTPHKNTSGILGVSNNHIMLYHKFLCAGGCIRNTINSGTDSMLGSCGHAEEELMWRLAKQGKTNYDIYIMQVGLDDNPIPKEDKYFYCARCATAMYYAEVRGVWVLLKKQGKPVWSFLSTKEAIESSYKFALREKVV
jgi:hypothetical protein